MSTPEACLRFQAFLTLNAVYGIEPDSLKIDKDKYIELCEIVYGKKRTGGNNNDNRSK